MSTKTVQSWDWDVRVRERNLEKGILTEKDVEKHLAQLHDAEGDAEPFGLVQPALSGVEEEAEPEDHAQNGVSA